MTERLLKYFSAFALLFLLFSCSHQANRLEITNGKLRMVIDNNFGVEVYEGKSKIPVAKSRGSAGFIESRNARYDNFMVENIQTIDISDSIGDGKGFIISGKYQSGRKLVKKQMIVSTYTDFPGLAVISVRYINSGDELHLKSWTENSFYIPYSSGDTLLWSFQGSSTDARKDWIRPVSKGYYDRNFMGMNSSDYGGGIPVCDVWNRESGIAIGHLEMHPLRLSLPVNADLEGRDVNISIQKDFEEELTFQKGDKLELPAMFISVHTGDCFSTLRDYSLLMQKRGISFPEPEPAAFEPVWCAWGYERNFTLDEITGTLPKVKELGFKWAVLDDGYQQAEGDWNVNKRKFPQGEKQMKELVNTIHSYGLKAKLWYAPLAADPCSNLLKENPDLLLYNNDWSYRFITWWDSWYMSPAYDKTKGHTVEVVKIFMDDWGFDGLKLDGQHMNAVPPDYNPEHNLEYPEQAAEELPGFFKLIYNTARSIKTNAVVEHCPCGCCMSFYNMQTTNQFVSSDPLSSWQIRLKGKVYKALAPATAYYGDHVELSDGGIDFASTVGIGGVPGTKFTWPKDNPDAEASYLLTPEKETEIKKWITIYNDKKLSHSKYLGDLYDIGFDKPETHVLKKGDTLYYSFYSNNWNGKIKLRGLDPEKTYEIFDYVNNIILCEVNGSNPAFETKFKKNLLIEVYTKQISPH